MRDKLFKININELVKMYKQTRDEEIFDVLHRRILAILNKIWRTHFHVKDFDDFMAEFNEEIVKVIDRYDESKGSFLTLLNCALKNRIINYHIKMFRQKRDRSKELNIGLIEHFKMQNNEDYGNSNEFEAGQCDKNVDFINLTTDLRKILKDDLFIIVMLKMEGYSANEISKILGVTHHVVYNRLRIIRRTLREYLDS